MALTAPVSNFKKMNLKIYIVMCLAFGAWFGYDGYLNKDFMEKNTKDGVPSDTLKFNRVTPYILGAGIAYFLLSLAALRDKKITADDNDLILANNTKIPYNSIEKIDKTNYAGKGCFVVTYKNSEGKEKTFKVSKRDYDKTDTLLEHLISKIS